VYAIFEWITKFVYLNAVWIFLSLLGLGLFGLFPATISVFTVVRKWLKKEEVPILSTCWNVYKESFIPANSIGAILVVSWIVLFYSLIYYLQLNVWIANLISFVLVVVLAVLSMMIIYVFPLYAEFEMGIKDYLKTALLLVIAFPFSSIFLFIIVIGSLTLIKVLPVIIFFYGSLIAYLVMFHMRRILPKLYSKYEKLMDSNK